jgi:hypothetical protein
VVKVEWSRAPDGEFTWELESEMMKNYPYLFSGMFNFADEISLRGEDCNIPYFIY